jgi:pimeloyl-ACP methyl ester carboxylesterase
VLAGAASFERTTRIGARSRVPAVRPHVPGRMLHYQHTLTGGVTQVERFEHGGGTLIDEVFGDGTDRHLVFMHGWGASRESLRGIAVLFQSAYRVHLFDFPGFGEAPPPPADWDTINYADLVQQYLHDCVSGEVVLVGHSFGGRIGIRLAARQLSQIRALVLMGVPGLPPPRFSRVRLRRSVIRTLRKALVAVRPVIGSGPVDWHTRTFGSRDYLAAGQLRSVFVRVVNEDLTENARAIACPVLLIWGSDDREAPASLAHRYQQLLNGRATVEMLPHKDHFPYTGTGAHLCAFKIRSWLPAHVES